MMGKSRSPELIQLSEEQLKELVREAGKAASQETIKTLEKERVKQEKEKHDQRYKTTKDMLKNYRREKQRIANEEKFTDEEQAEQRWAFLVDLIERPVEDGKMSDTISDFEKKRHESKYAIWLIENALRMYDFDVTEYGNEVEKRRFAELKALYIDDFKMDITELANMYCIDERVVYRDIGIATKIVMVYLFGAL